jgi:signal transduction histidine kinase
MRGRIGFESIEGLGSSFWVELPLAESNAAPG